MPSTAPNAFDWKEYTDEERAKRGDPFQEINRKALHSQSVSKSMNKLRDKKPSHGTVLGISDKAVSLKPPEMMKNAKTKK